MIQACCDCMTAMLNAGCMCCVTMNNTPIACGCSDMSCTTKPVAKK